MELSSHKISRVSTQDPVGAAIARSKGEGGQLIGNEYCTLCGRDMEFSIHTPIEHPARFAGGACYRDGAGQTCASCEQKLVTP